MSGSGERRLSLPLHEILWTIIIIAMVLIIGTFAFWALVLKHIDDDRAQVSFKMFINHLEDTIRLTTPNKEQIVLKVNRCF